MSVPVLSKLRLMASAQFDSQPLLCVVLAGDARLLDKLRREELRICLDFVLDTRDNAKLMTVPLKHTLCNHAVGNCRLLVTLASELLGAAAERDLGQFGEQLYFQVFAQPAPVVKHSVTSR